MSKQDGEVEADEPLPNPRDPHPNVAVIADRIFDTIMARHHKRSLGTQPQSHDWLITILFAVVLVVVVGAIVYLMG